MTSLTFTTGIVSMNCDKNVWNLRIHAMHGPKMSTFWMFFSITLLMHKIKSTWSYASFSLNSHTYMTQENGNFSVKNIL